VQALEAMMIGSQQRRAACQIMALCTGKLEYRDNNAPSVGLKDDTE
jgi:hypothetical protein